MTNALLKAFEEVPDPREKMASKKAKEKYSNSRSPMMSRKKKNQMTRSLDDLISSVDRDDEIDCAAAAAAVTADGAEWPEIPSVRKMAPAIMCILPPLSADFVCSVLLSLGATPLLTDGLLEAARARSYIPTAEAKQYAALRGANSLESASFNRIMSQ